MGRPPKADGGRRGHAASMRGQKSTNKKVLETPDNPEIPALPPAEDFLSSPFGPEEDVAWSPPVVSWWEATWTSPMSQEFVIPADLHGLYLGCYYLEKSLDPTLKPAEQNGWVKSFFQVQKDYGLNPSARETLKWQVAQGEDAQRRTNRLRTPEPEETKPTEDTRDHHKDIIELYKRNA